MRVLIVEDNPTICQMMHGIVSPLADAVYDCADGAQALAAYQTHHPDVVLMDIAVGAVDGITATRRIRAADPMAQIIIVTMFDEADLREAAQAAGASGYVLKDNLLELRQWLQMRHANETTNPSHLPVAEKEQFQ